MNLFGTDSGVFEPPLGDATVGRARDTPSVQRTASAASASQAASGVKTLTSASRQLTAFDAVAPSPPALTTLEQHLRLDLGLNQFIQPEVLTDAAWLSSGLSSVVNEAGDYKLTENSSTSAHLLYQSFPSQAIGETTSSVVFWAKAGTRSHCWLGFRQNNVNYAGFVDLTTGQATAGGQGNNITSITVTDASAELGAGWWKIQVVGNPDDPNTVGAIGISDGSDATSYAGDGSGHIFVKRGQIYRGSSVENFVGFGGRTVVEDQAGSHDATVVTGSEPEFLDIDGGDFSGAQLLTVPAWTPRTDAFTLEVYLRELGGSGPRTLLAQHEAGDISAWMFINASGQLRVQLSADGTNIAKDYRVDTPILGSSAHYLVARWDDSADSLDLFVDGDKAAAGDVTQITDLAFDDLRVSAADWTIGARDETSPADFVTAKVHEVWIYNGARTDQQISDKADTLGLGGGGGGGGGDELTYDDWKARVAPAGTLWVVNKFAAGASDSNAGTLASPWLTIQHAIDTVSNAADSIWVVGGTGIDDRYYPSATLVPAHSGSAATDAGRIWIVGDPSNRPLIDASVPLTGVTWVSQGNNVWRGAVSFSAPGYIKSTGYHKNCGEPPKLFENIWEQIQIVHRPSSGNDYAMHPLNIAESDTPATTEFEEGDFWAEGGHTSPSHIWLRLPGGLDPNSQEMRWVDKDTLFRFKGSDENTGRNFIGMANLDFAYGAGAGTQKNGVVEVRGDGWRLEKCSTRDGNTNGFTIRGDDHYLYNCQALRNGACNFRIVGIDNGVHADSVKRVTLDRCVMRYANAKGWDPAWEAGGIKITTVNQDNIVGDGITIKECYVADSGTEATWPGRGKWAPGIWFDVVAKRCLVRDNVIVRYAKGGVMQELSTNYLEVINNFIGFGKLNNFGCAQSNLGPPVRIQASHHGSWINNTFSNNQGKGAYIKANDSRAQDNFHTFENNIFLNNGTGSGQAAGDHEVYVADETHSPFNASTTNTFNGNIYKPKSGNNPFYKQGVGETSSLSTWYTYVGGSGDQIVTGQVLTDEASEFGYTPVAAYTGKGATPTHPLNYPTAWTVQRFAQPV